MNNKVEEIRILCECVGGSILEAIPNTFPVKGKCFVVQPANALSLTDMPESQK